MAPPWPPACYNMQASHQTAMAKIHRVTYQHPDRRPGFPVATHDLHCPKLAEKVAGALKEKGYNVATEVVWA